MKFNIGCGWRNFGEDWVHIDGGDYDHLDSDDIFIRNYKNDSADLIYASHFIEYLDREEVVPLLERWREVLKPSGVMRLAVPNFSKIASLYIKGYEPYGMDDFVGLLYGKMPFGDETIYHKTVYDYNSLAEILMSSGFTNIRTWDWEEVFIDENEGFDDYSQAYIPHMQKDTGLMMSLNVEAIK